MIRIIALMPCIAAGAFCMTLLHAAEDDLILSNVWLNQVDRNTEVLVFEKNQQLYAECGVLKQLKVKIELMSRSGRKPEFCLLTAAGILLVTEAGGLVSDMLQPLIGRHPRGAIGHALDLARVPHPAQCGTMARTSGSCLIGQQKATTCGTGRAAIKCATMRADKTSCSASLSAARRATMSRRNARRQPVLSSFASCITVI